MVHEILAAWAVGFRKAENMPFMTLIIPFCVSFRQDCVRPSDSRFLLGQEAADGGSADLKLTGDFGFAGFGGLMNHRRWAAEAFAFKSAGLKARV